LAVAIACLLGATSLAGADTSTSPAPPLNDNDLNSLNLNPPGKPLNSTATLQDVRDTTNATTQAQLFDPPHTGGGAEVTSCHGVAYGKTVWYDFFPQANGLMEIQTTGFPNVIAVYPYSQTTSEPNLGKEACASSTSFPSAKLITHVSRGASYTVQIGGVNDAGGTLKIQFDYAITAPKRLSAQATLKAEATSTGIKLLGLTVNSAKNAAVAVDCGGHCRSQTKRRRATESFPGLSGVQMPAGSQLHIRVTAPKEIGVYIQYDVVRGNFTKLTRCLEPGQRKAQKTCH
jgi:hypothetical protein